MSENNPWVKDLPLENDPSVESESKDALPPDTLGVAMSGGGIRSASFCLGVVQSMARHGWLPHVDMLSTVSGGGYTGTFLGRYFDQCRRFDDHKQPGSAQQRVADGLSDSRSVPLTWLRRHANYLAPTGFGEAMFNFAAFWRNFLSLHVVLGLLFFAIFGVATGLQYWLSEVPGHPAMPSWTAKVAPLTTAVWGSANSVWWIATELMWWLAALPLALAYWLVSQDYHERFISTSLAAAIVVAVGLLIGLQNMLGIVVAASAIAWSVHAWFDIRRREGHGDPDSRFRLALARNRLTYRLSFWTTGLVILSVLAAIDCIGSWLANTTRFGDQPWQEIRLQVTSVVLGGLALAPLLRGLAGLVASKDQTSGGVLRSLARIPYLPAVIMILIGAVLPLTIVSWCCHFVYGLGYTFTAGLIATAGAAVISWLFGRQISLPFVNRSGPLTIYAARLARVFMGAVNPARHRHQDGGSVTDVIEGDDEPFVSYAPHDAGGPLHIMNVAVNETVDVASQRGVRDRQSENMAVGPAGTNLSRFWHSFWRVEDGCRTANLMPIGNVDRPHPFLRHDGAAANTESLNVRQWMAISGAAVSPGMGRLTLGAQSLLLTLANVRLGYWWDSGIWSGDRAIVPLQDGLFARLKDACMRILATQALLVAELRGRFGGPWRRHFYLSDGGHFENTGAYELIRRRLPLVIVIDAGRDHRQQAGGLAELTRIVRIDFGAEIEPITSDAVDLQKTLKEKLHLADKSIANLGTLDELLATNGNPSTKHAALLKVTYPRSCEREDDRGDAWSGRTESWLLYIKSTVTGDEPADVRNYQAQHPDFPNESTADQFFDEPQWESYRKLGEHIGDKLFNKVTQP